MAVPVPAWNENEEVMAKPVEPFALASVPWVLVFADTVENTGWRLRAVALDAVVLLALEAAAEVPGPNWTAAPPLATVEAAVAVVAVAAEATPANASAEAATAAKSICFIWFSVLQ